MKVINCDQQGLKHYLHTTKKQIESTFWVPKIHQVVLLSPEKSTSDLFVKTFNPLQIEIISGQFASFESQYDSSR